jgi:hypothetical protein
MGMSHLKRWQKIVLVLFVLVLFSQIPFAYRRYQLGRLHAAIVSLGSQRQTPALDDGLIEYRGVAHVHSFLGGHSSGTFQEIIAAATSNKLDFVLMTEHPARDFNTAEMTLKGTHNGVLFINGNEVKTSSGDRLLLVPGDQQASRDSELVTKDVLSRRTAGLVFVAYPEQFRSWEASEFAGVEIYNVYTNARKINPLRMFFDSLWSYRSYPDLLFATFYERPSEGLRQWDQAISRSGEKLVAIAGNDSHANVGVSLNDSSGQPLIGLRLDPYDRSFRLVRLHVLIPLVQWEHSMPKPLDQESLLAAIAEGHCFVGLDLFGDTSGFRFTARDRDENKMMGDEIKLDDEVRLTARLPVAARVVLLKDGVAIKDDQHVSSIEFVAKEKGSYRIEVYLYQLPGRVKDHPWIISNPIYVK